MNEFKKRVIINELRDASVEEIEEIFREIDYKDNFRTVLDKFVKESIEEKEYTKRMIESETIKYEVIG